ncbi:MAG: hypothetical protein MI673_05405 [Thiotrichales bacterium]|nr:hypothetical protein [Thiotrichales bacterium]
MPAKGDVERLIRTLNTPVFLAGYDYRRNAVLTLHTARTGVRRNVRHEFQRILTQAGYPDIRCVVKRHKPASLERADSLQKLLKRFRHDEIIYDPTASIQRAQVVLQASQSVRQQLQDKVAGICFDAWHRILHIGLEKEAFRAASADPIQDLLEVETDIRTSLVRDMTGEHQDLIPAVRVCFGVPKPPAIPVDNATLHRICKICKQLNLLKLRSASTALAALFGFGLAGSAAAEGPAVSAPNSKIAAGGGTSEGDGTGQFLGSFTTPVGHSYGFQLDALGGKIGGESRWGVGGHLFWRDPDRGLLGAIASYNKDSNKDATRLGVEAEKYWEQFTVLGSAGGQTGDIQGGFFGNLDLRWYINDNAHITLGGLTSSGDVGGRLSAEYQPGLSSLPGLSLFADGVVADDFDQVLFGIRYYFGETKSLKRRHREDDPQNNLLGVSGLSGDSPPFVPPERPYGGGGGGGDGRPR